jgi:hypothetical protein
MLVGRVVMNPQQILYEAKLSQEGRKLWRLGWVVLLLWIGVGVAVCFRFSTFPGNLLPMVILVVGALAIGRPLMRVKGLRNNPGVYRVSVDDYGLYVHSDDPVAAPSFSVRRTIRRYESCDDYEYYVVTKSGSRHRIEQLFADYHLDVMRMFERIMERFPWVQIQEEVQP